MPKYKTTSEPGRSMKPDQNKVMANSTNKKPVGNIKIGK